MARTLLAAICLAATLMLTTLIISEATASDSVQPFDRSAGQSLNNPQ